MEPIIIMKNKTGIVPTINQYSMMFNKSEQFVLNQSKFDPVIYRHTMIILSMSVMDT